MFETQVDPFEHLIWTELHYDLFELPFGPIELQFSSFELYVGPYELNFGPFEP